MENVPNKLKFERYLTHITYILYTILHRLIIRENKFRIAHIPFKI